MQIYTFELAHPSNSTRPAIATFAAPSKEEAHRIIQEEFGRIFYTKFIRAADLPASSNFQRIITVKGPDGQEFEKAF
jgi:hypothetical protein